MRCTRGRIWKGDILVADIEELEQMDASEIYAKRLHAKEALTPMSGEKFILQIADGTVKLIGGEQVLRTSTLVRDSHERGEEQGNLQGESDGSCSTPLRDSSWYDGEAKNDLWSFLGYFIYRHHVEPRVKLYVPREESFPVPLKYFDVTRTTDTSLDAMLEKNIESRLQRDVRIWVNTVFILISLKTEIARSVRGPKLQGPHAEDAMAKPYLEPQILVT